VVKKITLHVLRNPVQSHETDKKNVTNTG